MTLYLIVIAVSIALDQLVKWWAVTVLKGMETLPIIKNVFHLTYVENTGAAFSIFSGKQTFLVLITSIAMTIMLVYLTRWVKTPGEFWAKLAFAMMIGGGIGNLIDRLRLGYVIDMFDARLINFAIFNVADSFVVVGVCLFIFAEVFLKSKPA